MNENKNPEICHALYDERIIMDYPSYFCQGVQQSANLLVRLGGHDTLHPLRKKRYKIQTSEYLIRGTPTKTGQSLDDDWDFNAHTVNEMFEFLCILHHAGGVCSFGEHDISLRKSGIPTLLDIGKGNCSGLIMQLITRFNFTSHRNVNGFRTRRFPGCSD